MIPAKFFNKFWDEGCIGLEVVELGRVLEQSHNSLSTSQRKLQV
jgi:hypothetical protein